MRCVLEVRSGVGDPPNLTNDAQTSSSHHSWGATTNKFWPLCAGHFWLSFAFCSFSWFKFVFFWNGNHFSTRMLEAELLIMNVRVMFPQKANCCLQTITLCVAMLSGVAVILLDAGHVFDQCLLSLCRIFLTNAYYLVLMMFLTNAYYHVLRIQVTNAYYHVLST